jgi:hypothetical protein
MWVELIMYDAQGEVLFASGDIADDEIEEHPEGDPRRDGYLWLMRDRMYAANDDGGGETEVHMFWQATRHDDVGNPSLPVPQPPPSLHSASRSYPLTVTPARATVRVRIRPIGLDVLHELVNERYLDADLLAHMPTFTVHESELVWRSSDPFDVEERRVLYPDCGRYECLLDPDSSECSR